MIGSTLSHYKITAELGRGGMGIVYRAQDTKLNREVAVKVLPSAALATAEDRARFYREAQAAAQLHHAHIATIFEIDEAVPSDAPHGTQPSPFIVMEYIEGETLDARIKKGPMKLSEVVRISTQIAEALKLAHSKNIVHRDIKSANVMLTNEGHAKVLDFGLAKTAQSTQLTRMGSTMGTVAYMSPEQARGEEVDAGTDIWALGVVIYEMITGRNPFGGDYEQAVVYSILNEDQEPLTAVRTGVPMELESIVSKCLRKEKRLRYQGTADLIADLEDVQKRGLSSSATVRSFKPGQMAPAQKSKPAAWSFLAFGLAGILIGALLFAWWGTGFSGEVNAKSDVIRSEITLSEGQPFLAASGSGLGLETDGMDISRDGSQMVYVSEVGDETVLVVYSLQDGTSRVLLDAKNAWIPRFSPDGNWIVYLSFNEMYRIPTEGGRPQFITNTGNSTGMDWADPEHIYYGDIQGLNLMRVTPEGASEHLSGDIRCNCGLPTRGPDGEGEVVSGRDQEMVLWFRDNEPSVELAIPGSHITFLKTGHVVYARTGALFASKYNPSTNSVEGPEITIADDLRTGSILRSGHYAISENGTLVYAAGDPTGLTRIIIRHPGGREEDIGLPVGTYGPINVSPDENFVLTRSFDRGGQLILFDRKTRTDRILSMSAIDPGSGAIWSPDGKSIAFVQVEGNMSKIMQMEMNSSSSVELTREDGLIRMENWSPDGHLIAYSYSTGATSKLKFLDLATNTSSEKEGQDDAHFWSPDWSPDGKFLTYTKVNSEGSYVYVESFPYDGTSKVISSGGEEAEWLPERNAFVYRDNGVWYIVEQKGTGLNGFSDPVTLFEGPYVNIAGMEYRMLSGERAILQRPINLERTTSKFEVISGLYTLLENALPK